MNSNREGFDVITQMNTNGSKNHHKFEYERGKIRRCHQNANEQTQQHHNNEHRQIYFVACRELIITSSAEHQGHGMNSIPINK